MRILIFAFFLCGFTINAQQYWYFIKEYKNGNPGLMLGVPGDQFKSTITFSNISAGDLYVHVKRTQKSIPLYWSQWYYYLQPKSPAQDTITLKLSPFSGSVLTVYFKTDSVKPRIATATFKMYQVGYADEAQSFNLTASTNMAAEVGIPTEVQSTTIRIFPNPANHVLNITTTDQNITAITIYDARGVEKFNSETVTQVHSVDISQYPAGIYLVKVAHGNTAYLHKVIKN